MAKMGEGPKATRMELIMLRRRIALAKRGHQLLEDKRDALISKFLELIERRENLRKTLEEKLREIYEKFKEAKATLGSDIYTTIAAIPPIEKIFIGKHVIMGVHTEEIKRWSWEPKYGLYGSSGAFDEMLKIMKDTQETFFKVIETENALIALVDEIKRTRRRVNALEYIIIPRMEKQARWIHFMLEERSREDFFRRKMIKRKKEEAQEDERMVGATA